MVVINDKSAVKITTAKDTKHAKLRKEITLCPFALLACFAVAISMVIGVVRHVTL